MCGMTEETLEPLNQSRLFLWLAVEGDALEVTQSEWSSSVTLEAPSDTHSLSGDIYRGALSLLHDTCCSPAFSRNDCVLYLPGEALRWHGHFRFMLLESHWEISRRGDHIERGRNEQGESPDPGHPRRMEFMGINPPSWASLLLKSTEL